MSKTGKKKRKPFTQRGKLLLEAEEQRAEATRLREEANRIRLAAHEEALRLKDDTEADRKRILARATAVSEQEILKRASALSSQMATEAQDEAIKSLYQAMADAVHRSGQGPLIAVAAARYLIGTMDRMERQRLGIDG